MTIIFFRCYSYFLSAWPKHKHDIIIHTNVMPAATGIQGINLGWDASILSASFPYSYVIINSGYDIG